MNSGRQIVKWCLYLVSFLFWLSMCSSNPLERQYTGVCFSPYVKGVLENGSFPSRTSYTIKEIEVMLEVISSKFSKVVTFSIGLLNETYKWNVTYHNSFSQVYISEAAARLNHAYNESRITVFQTIYIHDKGARSTMQDAETLLATECAERANAIFPKTVEGFLLSGFEFILKYEIAEQALQLLLFLRQYYHPQYQIRTRIDCEAVRTYEPGNNDGNKLWQTYNQILLHSDFVICQIREDKLAIEQAPRTAFYSMVDILEKFNKTMPNLNKPKLMLELKWASAGKFYNTIANMKEFWDTAIAWAGNHCFQIFFFEAFDEPNSRYSYYGWWKLTDNSLSENVAGYIEKVNEEKQGNTKKPTTINLIVVGAVTVVGILSSAIIFLLLRLKKMQQKLSKEDIREFVEGTSVSAVEHGNDVDDASCGLQYPYDYSFEMNIDQLKIQYDNILGTGQFGFVVKAAIEKVNTNGEREEVEVALKMGKPGCPQTTLKGLLAEIKILIYVGPHPNIVELVGAYTQELHKGIVYIATELCSLGSLQEYLRKQEKMPEYINIYENVSTELFNPAYVNTRKSISFHQMLKWSQEIARGMEYLGTKNVVHADLATRNILLNEEKTAKISDFGLSRRMYEYTCYIKTGKEPLPWRWMAIESLKRAEFSTKSDIWSYGVVLWEIFTYGDIPYPGLAWNVDFITQLVDGMRLGPPQNSTAELYKLMVECWHTEAGERPSFSQIIREIEDCSIKSGGKHRVY